MAPRPFGSLAAAATLAALMPVLPSAACTIGEKNASGEVCTSMGEKQPPMFMPAKKATGNTAAADAPTSVIAPGAAPNPAPGPDRISAASIGGSPSASFLNQQTWQGGVGALDGFNSMDSAFARGGAGGAGPGSLLQPSAPCASHPAQKCYPKEQLDKIAESLSRRWEDLSKLATNALSNPAHPGDVRPDDVMGALRYLDGEQNQIDFIENNTGIKWEDLQKQPQLLGQAWAKLRPDVQDHIRSGFSNLNDMMNGPAGLMKSDNGFHAVIMMNDPLKAEFVDKLSIPDVAPPMTGGQWAQGQPDNPEAHSFAAEEALKAGDAAGAAASAQKALDLDPRNEGALSTLAAARFDLKDMGGAASAANKALALDPNDAQAQTVAQLAHATVGANAKIPQASQQHRFADVPAGLSNAAPWRPLRLSDEKERQALSAARDAERALNHGDYSAAKAAADRALAADPHSAYAYGLKAFAEIKSGDAADALRDAVAGLAVNPADRMAQKARAQALLKLGRYDEGLLAARAAVAGDPRSGFARYLLAEALAANGDTAGARQALKEAAAMDLRYADMYKASLQATQLGDMAFLFPDLKPGAMDAARAAAAAGSPSRRAGRFAKIAGGAAAGGGLLAWLLWALFGAKLAPALKTVFTRRGPRVADPSGVPAAAAPTLDAPGHDPSLLRGQYKITRQIGIGGMGMVYEGTDVSLDRRVAIKKMRDELRVDRRSRERFVSEAKTVAGLHHPNVVDIYSIVDERDELYLIFEYVSGRTLHEIVHAKGPLSFAEALRVYRGVADALEYAHGRGIIHRDLKPSNIMLTDEGQPKVMDFGIARAAKDALTRYSMTNTVVGTPPYMAPEQEQGVVRTESDVYALAVCLYESLTGALPFSGSGAGMLLNKVNKAYTPASRLNPSLPPGVDAVFDKAFEPDPEKRYRTVVELRAALEALPVSAAAPA